MTLNNAMRELLGKYNGTRSQMFPLNSKLNELLDAGINEREGVFLFASVKSPTAFTASQFGDLTGYECAMNHVHIEDFLNLQNQLESVTLLMTGVGFAYRLKDKLASSYPQERFRVILSYNLENLGECVVRWHKIRKSEDWIKLDDLEGYETEAIMVIDT